jgi:hypothetical protein
VVDVIDVQGHTSRYLQTCEFLGGSRVRSAHDHAIRRQTQSASPRRPECVPHRLRTAVFLARHVEGVRLAGRAAGSDGCVAIVVGRRNRGHLGCAHHRRLRHQARGVHRGRRDGRRVLYATLAWRLLADQQRRGVGRFCTASASCCWCSPARVSTASRGGAGSRCGLPRRAAAGADKRSGVARSMASTHKRFDDATGRGVLSTRLTPVARWRDLRLGREISPKHDH